MQNKYIIQKSDGSPVDHRAEYFVLRIDSFAKDREHVIACRKALFRFATFNPNPELEKDIRRWLNRWNKYDIDNGLIGSMGDAQDDEAREGVSRPVQKIRPQNEESQTEESTSKEVEEEAGEDATGENKAGGIDTCGGSNGDVVGGSVDAILSALKKGLEWSNGYSVLKDRKNQERDRSVGFLSDSTIERILHSVRSRFKQFEQQAVSVDWHPSLTCEKWVGELGNSDHSITGYWAEDHTKYYITVPPQLRQFIIEAQNRAVDIRRESEVG